MKKVLVIVLSLVMVIAVAACSTKDTPSDESPATEVSPSGSAEATPVPADDGPKGKIGTLLPSLSFDFQAQMAAGVQRAADEFGYEYQGIDYNFDPELEASGIETLVASGVQGYYGIFISSEADSAKLKENPEIGTISQAMDVEANAFIVNDYQALGEQFIDSLDYFRTENNIEGGDMACIWLTTCEVEDSDFYRAMMTMKDIFIPYCDDEGIDYVSDQYAETDEDASNIAEQLLNAYPDLRYIFCFNNGYALVTSNEISAAVKDTSEYFVFSSEGDAESFRMIASNDSPYRGCAYQDIEECGYQAGLQLINWIENGEINDVVAVRTLVDIRNVQDYLD
jgi:ABC-type sugar transport system substrate-binding protein